MANEGLMLKKMNPMQRAFAEHYFRTPRGKKNATASAIHAGYSEKSAKSQATKLLTHPAIRAWLIEQDEDLRLQRHKIDENWFLTELVHLWETPITALFDEEGALKPLHELGEDAAKLIQGFKLRQHFENVYDDDGNLVEHKLTSVETFDVKFIDRLKVLLSIGNTTEVNAYGSREKADAAGSFADMLDTLTDLVKNGKTIDAEVIKTLMIGENENG